MAITINAKELRASLPRLVERVRKGARFVVIYRSRPAFQIIPVDVGEESRAPLEGEALYKAAPVGRSTDERTAAEHDDVLYGR